MQLLDQWCVAALVIWHVSWSIEVECDGEDSRKSVCHSGKVVCVLLGVAGSALLATWVVAGGPGQVCLKFMVDVELCRVHACLTTEAMRSIGAEVLHKRQLAFLAARPGWLCYCKLEEEAETKNDTHHLEPFLGLRCTIP